MEHLDEPGRVDRLAKIRQNNKAAADEWVKNHPEAPKDKIRISDAAAQPVEGSEIGSVEPLDIVDQEDTGDLGRTGQAVVGLVFEQPTVQLSPE